MAFLTRQPLWRSTPSPNIFRGSCQVCRKQKAAQPALCRPNLLTKHGTNHEVTQRNSARNFSNWGVYPPGAPSCLNGGCRGPAPGWRERRKAEQICDEGGHFRVVPAEPVKRSAGGLKRGHSATSSGSTPAANASRMICWREDFLVQGNRQGFDSAQ